MILVLRDLRVIPKEVHGKMSVVRIRTKDNDNVVLAELPLLTIDTTVEYANVENIAEIETDEECIDRFIAKAKAFRGYPPAQFSYHAFGNITYDWTPEIVKIVIDHAREHGLEVRAWCNEQSATNLLVVKDPDMTEDSGWELYQKMKDQIGSYGLASGYEFETYGLPVYTGEDVIIRSSAAGNMGLIQIGRSEDWICLN